MREKNTDLQDSACTAVSELIECAGDNISSGISIILETHKEVCPHYYGNSLLALLDMLGLLVKTCDTCMQDNEAIEMLITPLTNKWNEINDNDKIIGPLFKCFEYITDVIGNKIDPYANTIVERCLRIIASIVESIIHEDNKNEYDIEFAIKAFELLTAIIKKWSDNHKIVDSDYFKIILKI